MAAGDLEIFEEAKKSIADGTFDLSNTTEFKVMLITTLPTAADATPDDGNYTEVSGSGYTAGGIALTTSWDEVSGTVTFDDSVNPAWTKTAGGPEDIVAGLIYFTNASATGKNALAFVDMTSDLGVTPISLIVGDISITWHINGILTLS